MPNYDFACKECEGSSEFFFTMSSVPREIVCACGSTMTQVISAKSVSGKVPPGWSDGKEVFHLHPRDPDRHVTSEKQMREVYDKAGISMDTGEVRDEKKFEARKAAILNSPGKRAHQGVIDKATKSKSGQGRVKTDFRKT